MHNVEIQVTPPFERVGSAISLIKMGAALQRAIEKAAYAVEKYAKKETPVDTGRLRASIFTDIGTLQARIAPNTAYASWIHEGWRMQNGKKIYIKGMGRAGTPVGGKPFMKLGMETTRQSMEGDIIVKELSLEIEKNLKGLK